MQMTWKVTPLLVLTVEILGKHKGPNVGPELLFAILINLDVAATGLPY